VFRVVPRGAPSKTRGHETEKPASAFAKIMPKVQVERDGVLI
jgi:hypothetical protein